MNDLVDHLVNVCDKKSFLAFFKALIRDREDTVSKGKINCNSPYTSEENGWENGTIESYLEAAVACTEDHGDETVLAEIASWRSFAQFLYVGKSYE